MSFADWFYSNIYAEGTHEQHPTAEEAWNYQQYKIDALQQQIEKMKCCNNCKYHYISLCACEDKNKWEMRK
jgi:hypothetical protein